MISEHDFKCLCSGDNSRATSQSKLVEVLCRGPNELHRYAKWVFKQLFNESNFTKLLSKFPIASYWMALFVLKNFDSLYVCIPVLYVIYRRCI